MGRALALAVIAAALAWPAPASADLLVRATTGGVPHIRASSYGELGFGYGQLTVRENLCTVAENYVTTRGERSLFFGPDQTYLLRANESSARNLDSDFFYGRIRAERVVERLLDRRAPLGPRGDVRAIVDGYARGYNAALRKLGGADGVRDPACKGRPWVREITPLDAWRHYYGLILLGSSGIAVNEIGGAQPPTQGAPAAAPVPLPAPGLVDRHLGSIGSNAIALGRDAVAGRGSLHLGNSHFPWDGVERYYQVHFTVPGKLDVMGATLIGTPLVVHGYTRNVAFGLTVSTARRFTPFELRLAPGDPTSYLVDGQPEPMRRTDVEVEVRTQSGGVETRRRTMYGSRYGWLTTGLLGTPVFPWTTERAYALGDANADNVRIANVFMAIAQARDVGAIERAAEQTQGLAFFNVIASDRDGGAFYGDIGPVPAVDDEHSRRCLTPLGVALDRTQRVQVLDGSQSTCGWQRQDGAVVPGLFAPQRQPRLRRNDYVTNSNDSYWLVNHEVRNEGFPRIQGEERVQQSLRTRLGFRMVLDRLGSGGFRGLPDVQGLMFANRNHLAELWLDELIPVCRTEPVMVGSSGPVDVRAACEVLARWDRREQLDSRGGVLFRRFAERALSSSTSPYRVPFDPEDPIGTPRGLRTESPEVRAALADAVTDLQGARIALDAPLGEVQTESRGDEAIPVHGGPGGVGSFNAIYAPWQPGVGLRDVTYGASYVQAVRVDGRCPKARTLMAYSQSSDPTSEHYADGTRRFSRQEWIRTPFCERHIASDPNVRTLISRRSACRPARRVRLLLPRAARRRPRSIRAVSVRADGRRIARRTGRAARRRSIVVRVPAGARRLTLAARLRSGRLVRRTIHLPCERRLRSPL